MLHTAATGDLDAYLWDPLVSCDSDIVGEGGDGTELALGFSGTDDELLDYTNFTGADQDLILWVRGRQVTITKAALGAAQDLQVLGSAAPAELDALRLRATSGDRSAVNTLAEIAQRGAEKLWEGLLNAVGPSRCIRDVPALQILRRDR